MRSVWLLVKAFVAAPILLEDDMDDELRRQQAHTDYLMDGGHEGGAFRGAVNAILIVAVVALAFWGVL